MFGGFVELDGEVARAVATKDALDLRVLVCVTTEAKKAVGSSEGMGVTARESPFYPAWLEEAPRLHRELRAALLAGDFDRVGELAERSALAMHASAMAAGVVYVSGATLAALDEVRALRRDGISAWATIDAGPHLKCLVRSGDVAAVRARLEQSPGVLRVLVAEPGDGARIVEVRS